MGTVAPLGLYERITTSAKSNCNSCTTAITFNSTVGLNVGNSVQIYSASLLSAWLEIQAFLIYQRMGLLTPSSQSSPQTCKFYSVAYMKIKQILFKALDWNIDLHCHIRIRVLRLNLK